MNSIITKLVDRLTVLFFIRLVSGKTKAKIFAEYEKSFTESQYSSYRSKYNISNKFRFNGRGILFYGDGQIICGDDSYIGNFSSIQSIKGHKVVIGKRCAISHNVRIYTSNRIADQDFSSDTLSYNSGDVIIGDNVWIGANVFIREGVTIGSNSVIGANSVVTNSVLQDSIYGGVPCKLLKFKSYKTADSSDSI